MKIKFTTNTKYSVEDLVVFSNTEGVGFENDFGSRVGLDLTDPEHPIWTTSWSRFSYKFIGNENSRDVWEFVGAQNGFGRQDLLFPLPEIEILEVEGSHGEFRGDCALDNYENQKRLDREEFSKMCSGFDWSALCQMAAAWAVAGRPLTEEAREQKYLLEREEQKRKEEKAKERKEDAKSVLQKVWFLTDKGGEIDGISLKAHPHRSGCGERIFDIIEDSKTVGYYFGGDRCNAADFHYKGVQLSQEERAKVKYRSF